MVTWPVAMVPFVEGMLVVRMIVFAFVLPPEVESAVSFVSSAVFGMDSVSVLLLSAFRVHCPIFLMEKMHVIAFFVRNS